MEQRTSLSDRSAKDQIRIREQAATNHYGLADFFGKSL
jgi:hypothetical protein